MEVFCSAPRNPPLSEGETFTRPGGGGGQTHQKASMKNLPSITNTSFSTLSTPHCIPSRHTSAAANTVTIIASFHCDRPYLFPSRESSVVGGRNPRATGSVGLTVEILFQATQADGSIVPFRKLFFLGRGDRGDIVFATKRFIQKPPRLRCTGSFLFCNGRAADSRGGNASGFGRLQC